MKNKILAGIGIITALAIFGNIVGGNKPQVAGTQIQVTPAPTVAASPTSFPEESKVGGPVYTTNDQGQVTPRETTAPVQDTGLSNNNTYVNTAGNTVHSPAYSNSVPAGATAVCGDGTYSFSQSRRGTCSRHGGVAEWL